MVCFRSALARAHHAFRLCGYNVSSEWSYQVCIYIASKQTNVLLQERTLDSLTTTAADGMFAWVVSRKNII